MAADLTGLERAAARVGLPDMAARVVPADGRHGWWFVWSGHDLQVSEKVIDRCLPEDAEALLMCAVLERKALRRWRLGLGVAVVALIGGVFGLDALGVPQAALWSLPLVLVVVAAAAIQRQRIRLAADDRTVSLLGDAERLVRGMNCMNKDELVIGKRRMPARPDLHPRAERLIAKHGLCSAVPPAGATDG